MKHIKTFGSLLNEEVPYNFEVGASKVKIYWSEEEKKDLEEIGADYIGEKDAKITYDDLEVTVEKVYGPESFNRKSGYYSHKTPDHHNYGWGSGRQFGYKIYLNKAVSETTPTEYGSLNWKSVLKRIDLIFNSYKRPLRESLFKNPFKKTERAPRYKSQYVEHWGEMSKEKYIILKTIDTLRDSGIEIKDASGELTDGDDIWLVKNFHVCLRPDYRGKIFFIESSRPPHKKYGMVKFSDPEKMADEIKNIIDGI
jgi:hypothetical protein